MDAGLGSGGVFLKSDHSIWGIWATSEYGPGEPSEIKIEKIVSEVSEIGRNGSWAAMFRKGSKLYDIAFVRRKDNGVFHYEILEREDFLSGKKTDAMSQWGEWTAGSRTMKEVYGEDVQDVVIVRGGMFLLKTDGSLWRSWKKIMEDVLEIDGRYALIKDGSLWDFTYDEPKKYLDHVQAGKWGSVPINIDIIDSYSSNYAITADQKLWVWGGFIGMYDQPQRSFIPSYAPNSGPDYLHLHETGYTEQPVVVAENVEKFFMREAYRSSANVIYSIVRTDGSLWNWGQMVFTGKGTSVVRTASQAMKVSDGKK